MDNNGLKSHSAAVLPSMDILTSAQVIQFQTDISMKEMNRKCCKNTVNVSLTASLPIADKVNPLLTSILQQQWNIRNNFYIRRRDPPNKYEWLVVIKDEHSRTFHNIDYEENPFNNYIPRFRRVRVVKLNFDGQMECSCRLFSRFGHGCVHILSVILFENPSYSGYTQNDVCVFWWNDYCFYAERGEKYSNGGAWDRRYMELLDNDIKGPSMPKTWTCPNFVAKSNVTESVDNIDDSIFALKPAVQRVRNYSPGQAKQALRIFTENMQRRPDGSTVAITGAVGYSQLCNVEMEAESDEDNTLFSETDGHTFKVPVSIGNTSSRVNVRSRLAPIIDDICSLYESKKARHSDMPSIEIVVDFLNETVHNINGFFIGLDKNKKNTRNNNAEYVSVSTKEETSRGRCFVSSNGLK